MAVSKAGRKGRESRKGSGGKRSDNGSSKSTVGNQAAVQLLQDGAGPDGLAVEHAARIGNQAAGAVVAHRKEDSGADLPTLRLGSTGPAVKRLQLALTTTGSQLQQDGHFGKRTDQAVRRFQEAHGLDADGVVGQQTWAALTSAPPVTTPQQEEGVIHGAETPLEEAKAAFRLGQQAHNADDYATSLRYFRRAYVIPDMEEPVRYAAANNMALAYERLGDVPNAIQMHQEALLFPSAADHRARHLEALRRMRSGEQPAPGQNIGAKPVESSPEERAAADQAAQAQIDQGSAAAGTDDNAALNHFMAAYSSRHAGPDLRLKGTYLTGRAHQALSAFPTALDFYQEALSFPTVGPKERTGILEFVRQARLGQPSKDSGATEKLDEAEQEKLYNEGKALLDGGDYAGALGRWSRVYALKDAKPEVRQYMAFDMGIAHQRMQHFPEAISLFEESLQFPGTDDGLRIQATEHIRQCRNGEMAFQVHAGEGAATPGPVGQEQRLFSSNVFFATGAAGVGSTETLQALVARIVEHHNSHDGTFRIVAAGRSSSRWGNADEETADERNRLLSRQRTDAVAEDLQKRLPPEVAVTLQREAHGDENSEALGLPPNDNSWVERTVGVVVYFTPGRPG